MRQIYFLFIVVISLLTSCKTTYKPEGWYNIAVIQDVEIFTDSNSIKHEGAVAYAREKRVYITPESRKLYVDKIRDKYAEMGSPKKADKWHDFSYCIYNCIYECTNKKFRVISVEDYDSTGKLIAKSTPPKDEERWLNVGAETVGDYSFFFVCDYQQK